MSPDDRNAATVVASPSSPLPTGSGLHAFVTPERHRHEPAPAGAGVEP